MKTNIVLVGMPGSGKSTVGVLLAKRLGLDFVDTDLLLQKREGKRLADIVAQRGSEGFLRAENALLGSLRLEATVISTGGSAVYHEAMQSLKEGGRVLWLDVPLVELEQRLGDFAARGVVLAPGQTLRALYEERHALYQQWADGKLEVSEESLEVTVSRAENWSKTTLGAGDRRFG